MTSAVSLLNVRNRPSNASTTSRSSLNLEAILTRDLGVRFIDARAMATEAKLNLGIEGYVSPDDYDIVLKEASRIYNHGRTVEEQNQMKILKATLDNVKLGSNHSTRLSLCSSDGGSRALDVGTDDEEDDTNSTSELTDGLPEGSSKKPRRRRRSKDFGFSGLKLFGSSSTTKAVAVDK
jgi:hypothetical protein